MQTQFEKSVVFYTKVLGYVAVAGKDIQPYKLKDREMLIKTVGNVEKLIFKGNIQLCFDSDGNYLVMIS